MAYVPDRARRRRHPARDRRSWQDAPAPSSRTSRSTERAREWPRPATPRICSTTPSTTGRASTPPPRAGDARDHLVRAGRARRGRVLRAAGGRHDAQQGRLLRRGRVGQGRLGCVAPLSGEIVEVNERAQPRTPAMINEDPYGEGWLVKVRLSDPAEREALLDAASYRRLAGWLGCSVVESLHRHHPAGPRRDARGDRRRLLAGDLRPPDPRGGASRPRARAARRAARAGRLRAPARAGRAQHQRRGRAQLPRRRHVRPLRPGADRHADGALGVPDPLHALSAGDLPGRAAGDVRVPDRDLRADRACRSRTPRSTRGPRPSPPPAIWRSCTTAARASSSAPACTRTRSRRCAPTPTATAWRSIEVPLRDGVTDPDAWARRSTPTPAPRSSRSPTSTAPSRTPPR